ncbi:hypothetical protein PPERSA_04193 [Pseudocohnilembus persalinus]|uniref:Transmembrane protein n=1 Tax=Pseudocohnilembus persalinus TaxID=266149 RepID=A0A0V0QMQ5_PSEPJ|nr:hypothetical protein PPERSA_04193 [Pseudocohnilembus persalinus]|eukprot:KRX03641.1 hypothetical protein PPERSA_04193 [Pseudocohnilembus persalinus]
MSIKSTLLNQKTSNKFLIIFILFILAQQVSAKDYTDQQCTNQEEADLCPNYCCDGYGFCADDAQDCSIYGHKHCIYLSCTQCCFKSRFDHTCGTTFECDRDSYRSVLITFFGIILIPAPFIVLILIRCVKNIKKEAKHSLYEKMDPNDAQELQKFELSHIKSTSPFATPNQLKKPYITQQVNPESQNKN